IVLDRLLHGEQVRLKQLFKDEVTVKTLIRSAESIRRRIREYDEERGVRIGRLVFAFASWTESRTTRSSWGRFRGRGAAPAGDPEPPATAATGHGPAAIGQAPVAMAEPPELTDSVLTDPVLTDPVRIGSAPLVDAPVSPPMGVPVSPPVGVPATLAADAPVSP